MKTLNKDAQDFYLIFSKARNIKPVLRNLTLIAADKCYGRTAFYCWTPKINSQRAILYISRINGDGNAWEMTEVQDGKLNMDTLQKDLTEDQVIDNILNFV